MENLVHRVTLDHLACLVTRDLLVNKEKLDYLVQRDQEDTEDPLDHLATLESLVHLDLEDHREKLETQVLLVNRVTLENLENVDQGYVIDLFTINTVFHVLFRVQLESLVTLEPKVCLVWRVDLVHLDLLDLQVHLVTQSL